MFDEEEDHYFGHEDEDRQLEGEDGWVGICSQCGCDIYATDNFTTEFSMTNENFGGRPKEYIYYLCEEDSY